MPILIFRDLKLHGKKLEVVTPVWREWLDLLIFQIIIQKPRLRCKHAYCLIFNIVLDKQEWNLSVPEGYKIRLTFNSFNIENHSSCGYDYALVGVSVTFQRALNKTFQVSYGTFSQKYCGSSKPDPITSTGDTMKVKFHSDNSVVRKGFSAVWKAVTS